MGLLPDLLPGYVPVITPGDFAAEYPGMPAAPGMTQPEMFEAAANGDLGCTARGRRKSSSKAERRSDSIARTPWSSYRTSSSPRQQALADVVFPAASLYEKTGTVTNAFGDVQLTRKGC